MRLHHIVALSVCSLATAGLAQAAELTPAPASLTFAQQAVGTQSVGQTVTWTNASGASQTVTGMAHVHGGYVNEDHAPLLQPGAVTDYTTGFLAAYGSLIALHRRALETAAAESVTGRGAGSVWLSL